MTFSLSGTLTHKPYNAPNAAVDAARERTDQAWRVNFLASIPLSKRATVVANVQRNFNRSNIRNFVFDSTLASLGLSWRH